MFDDHVKTYYTEGTPMDTPFMFSTATSMNDLREPAIAEEDEQAEMKKMSQENDTTVAYAVEGTPMVFSRAESLSDLESIADTEANNAGTEVVSAEDSKQSSSKDNTIANKLQSHCQPSVGHNTSNGCLMILVHSLL